MRRDEVYLENENVSVRHYEEASELTRASLDNVKIENQSNFIHRAYKATPSKPFETDSCFPSTWNGIELYCRLMRQSFNALWINFGREQGQQFIETRQSNSGHVQAYCPFIIVLYSPSFYVFN